MILFDTNVLIYGFDANSPLHAWAISLIRQALLGEGAAINPVILAEYLVGEKTPSTGVSRLEALGFSLLDLPSAAAPRCAQAYSLYLANRRAQPAPDAPKSPFPDFFIGAHASLLGLPLASADTDRYRKYFPEVRLITPAETAPA